MKDLTVAEVLKLNPVFVDLRSPKEYQEDHLPGAVNLPLLDDKERHVVGTAYAQDGSDKAKELGLEFVAPKLPGLVGQIRQLGQNKPVVIYCWRGGLRSLAMGRVLELMNVPNYRLQGGYKAFRRYVYEYFQQDLPYKMVVLHGLTGTGKTEIIRELIKMGEPAIDLEGLANNRGSVFGNVGLGEQPTQKRFETCLFSQFQQYAPGSFVVVEGESKRIGRNYVPDNVFRAMQNGIKVLVYDDFSHRVERIIKEYRDGTEDNTQELIKSLSFLTKRLGKKRVDELKELLNAGNILAVVEYLLVNYYDPLYNLEEIEKECQFTVSGHNPEQAAQVLKQYLSTL